MSNVSTKVRTRVIQWRELVTRVEPDRDIKRDVVYVFSGGHRKIEKKPGGGLYD